MDHEMKEMFQLIINKLDGQDQELKAIKGDIKQLNLKIENDVSKRIEALFDGYKLTHEKQWELERKVNELEHRLERLENAG